MPYALPIITFAWRRTDKHQPASTADVEDGLVALPRHEVEQTLAARSYPEPLLACAVQPQAPRSSPRARARYSRAGCPKAPRTRGPRPPWPTPGARHPLPGTGCGTTPGASSPVVRAARGPLSNAHQPHPLATGGDPSRLGRAPTRRPALRESAVSRRSLRTGRLGIRPSLSRPPPLRPPWSKWCDRAGTKPKGRGGRARATSGRVG